MPNIRDIGEFGLINRLARTLPSTANVVEGIGDDCAVLRVYNHLALVSCDMFVENVHFRLRNMSPEDIGWKAAAGALSDIAAMGGAPRFCLTALACPPETDVVVVDGIYQGMNNLVTRFGAVIVGGDTTSSPQGIVLDITVLGECLSNRCLRRRGAQIGDWLMVTGHLGCSAAGFHALEHGHDEPDLVQAHHRPRPRVPEGQWLCARESVHAMIDLSDGLVQDAEHVADASQLGVDIDPERLPISEALESYCREHGLVARQFMLTGGEDYELAFAVDAADVNAIQEAFRNEFRTPITPVGRFTDAWIGARVGGKETETKGFSHF